MKMDFAKTIAITAAILLMLSSLGAAQVNTFVKLVMTDDIWEVSSETTFDIEVYVYSADSVSAAQVGLKIKPEYRKLLKIESASVGPNVCLTSYATVENEMERVSGSFTDTADYVLFGGAYFPSSCPAGFWERGDTVLLGTITLGFEDTLVNSTILDDSLELWMDTAFIPPAGNYTFSDIGGNNMPIDTTYQDTVWVKKFVDVKEINQGVLPEDFSLGNNYPNPFNPATNIEFALPKNAHVKLDIYNMLGQKVRTLVDEELDAGWKVVRWDGKDDSSNEVASGVYLYKMTAGNFSQSKKMTLVK